MLARLLRTASLASFRSFSTSAGAAAAVEAQVSTASSAAERAAARAASEVKDVLQRKPMDVMEAFNLVRAFSYVSFDEAVNIAVNLGVDPRKPNQNVRGIATVPHSSGKKAVIAVFAQGEKALEAKAAGADIVGDEDLVKAIQEGKIEFNRCLATPDMMRIVAKVARILGPKGLMPNPKMGTVTTDLKSAIEASRQGQIEYRAEKHGIVHAAIGKVSWPNEKLKENLDAFVKALADAKPSGAKGVYFKSAYISSTAGPLGFPLDMKVKPFKVG